MAAIEPPDAHTRGGARRYSAEAEARVERIRELQQLMGFDLEQIRTLLSAEDRLAQLRSEFRAGRSSRDRQEQILTEAIQINDRLRHDVKEKLARTHRFLEELERKARRYRTAMRELDQPVETSRSADLRRADEGVRLTP